MAEEEQLRAVEMLVAKMVTDAVVQRLPLALVAAEMVAHVNAMAKGVDIQTGRRLLALELMGGAIPVAGRA